MKKLVIISLFAITFNAAYGGIEWNTKEISLEVQSGQGPIEVSFPFTVTGSDSVAVISTQASCSCVVVNPVEGELKPGTEGVLKARYTPRADNSGTMVEKITVRTTDPKAQSVDLRLLVYAPLTYRLNPRQAFWNTGESPDVKDLYFFDLTGKGYKPVLLYSSSTNFTATLIPPEGKATKYTIRIKPVSTKEPEGAYVFVDVDMGDGSIQKCKILAAIRDPSDPKIRIK